MPMHNFKCKNDECNHLEEEVIVKWDVDYIDCPKCKSKMVRMLTSYNFHLKGGGWAKDGYTKR
jgi:putative FmdB family regulatory protein